MSLRTVMAMTCTIGSAVKSRAGNSVRRIVIGRGLFQRQVSFPVPEDEARLRDCMLQWRVGYASAGI